MPEWFIGPVLKTVVRASVPWVRIPPLPPFKRACKGSFLMYLYCFTVLFHYIYKVNFLDTKKLYNEAIHIINKAIKNKPDKLVAYQIAKILYDKINNINMVHKMQISIDKIKQKGV